jgi:23S rRNA (uracil1939-C5)-methyltransferase
VEADADAYAWAGHTKIVVLDPPRTGARQVAERLASGRVPTVVYVSCDAQTLGRDLGVLSASYDAASIATFEMFPQTSHVETVVVLERHRR